MHVVDQVDSLRAQLTSLRRGSQRIALVPTMGNLHGGHHSLIALARQQADFIVASVFVNPTQFGPNEDFARYPRTPDADAAGLEAAGCDLMFLPPVEAMYPFGTAHSVDIHVPVVSEPLEGALRPGHFNGVASVVARLFNLVQPDVAIFGRKDYQQLLVIRRMVADLGFPIEIIGAPIIREADGLAKSSRNQYLSDEERARSVQIHQTLLEMQRAHVANTPLAGIESAALSHLRNNGFVPDYATIRHATDLSTVSDGATTPLVALIAARLGSTRLIDNLEFEQGI